MSSPVLRELKARGLLNQCTDLDGLDARLAAGRVAVYAGFDATADSLHVGHLIALLTLRVFREHGHQVIPVIGTGTALVGDPTGRSAARPHLAAATMHANAVGVRASIARVLGDGAITNSWLEQMQLIDFLREVGGAVPLSHLLALESVASRRDSGLSVLEACYPLLQAYDFLHLARQAAAESLPLVQIGGSDQWGNICTGLELIAKREPGLAARGLSAFGLTTPLLTNSNGEKMGKTTGGAVWLNPDRLDDFGFFQFWRNAADDEVERLLRLVAPDPHAVEIPRDDGELNLLKRELARHATALVRGAEAAARAEVQAQAVFSAGGVAGLRQIAVPAGEIDLPTLLAGAGLAAGKAAARRLIDQGGVRLDGVKVATYRLAPLGPQPVCLAIGRTHRVALVAS